MQYTLQFYAPIAKKSKGEYFATTKKGYLHFKIYNMVSNKKITCIAVDDEMLALEILKKYINTLENLELVGVYTDAVHALTVLQQQTVDVVFLDIQMPQLLGTDLVRSINKPPKIIFTTGYSQFAIEAFELNAVDYLLKPISFERFVKAVNKVMNGKLQSSENNQSTDNNIHEQNGTGGLTLRVDKKNVLVSFNEILYIESLRDYIKVVTIHKTIVTKYSISTLKDILPKNEFIRIHRSYIVAISKIQSFTNETIGIEKKELPISRMYKMEVEKILHSL
jgi:DNA-binding LytR/AlgR family response regulator